MADYNIYRIVRLDMGSAHVPIYVGMTDRTFPERWTEHRQSCNGLYKINCKGGLKGEVKDPTTSHGARADKPMFHFIRDVLGGINNEGITWAFEEIANADKQTEDDWIDLYISMGYQLYNLKGGEGEFVTKRSPAGVDLTGCVTIEDVAQRRAEYEAERKHKAEERKRAAAERKARREALKDIPLLEMRFEIQIPQIIDILELDKNATPDKRDACNDTWDVLAAWIVDYNSYLHLMNTKQLREAVHNIENTVHELNGMLQ